MLLPKTIESKFNVTRHARPAGFPEKFYSVERFPFFFLLFRPPRPARIFQRRRATAHCSRALVNHPVVGGPTIQVETYALPSVYIIRINDACGWAGVSTYARAYACREGAGYIIPSANKSDGGTAFIWPTVNANLVAAIAVDR